MLFKVNPKSLTTLLFSLLISATLYSQKGTIRGTVYDKESGEPRLSHRIDKSTGMYNGRHILKQKTKSKA